ncbi:MAG TPA: DUF4214 domain-containing protein [Pirellulales bacterium]|nr:DUF4214 domain-containing protein [Pirellulales bacterium]
MSISLISSAEYFQTRGGGTASGFLHALYQDLLGRDVDSEGLSYFTDLLAKGRTTADVAAMVFGSAEYHRVLVDSLYEKLLDRPADPDGLAYFADELAHGATEESIIVEPLSSDEYYAKSQE